MGILLRVGIRPARCANFITTCATTKRDRPNLTLWLSSTGFEPRELIGHPSLDLVHPDEFPQVRAIHYSTITQDQAAVLAYLRMRHKDPCRGYILCAIVSFSLTTCSLTPFVILTHPLSHAPYVKTSSLAVSPSHLQVPKRCTTRPQHRRSPS